MKKSETYQGTLYENGLLIKIVLLTLCPLPVIVHIIKVYCESHLIRLQCELLELNFSFIETFIFQELKQST